jgi:multimeric flavodoxin WrbA
MINILGICGSPVKESNTELMLREALKTVEGNGVEVNVFTLYGKKIEDCRQCNWCMAKQTEDEFCAVKDGLEELYPRVVKADALMVASPVYLARLSGHLASVLDRLRCIHYGKHYAGGMKHKIGAAIAVSWLRNSGIETTLTSIHWAFLSYQMVIAVPGSSISTFGGAGLSSLSGTGEFDPKDKHQVLKDEHGLKGARATARSMLELTKIMRAGKGHCTTRTNLKVAPRNSR